MKYRDSVFESEFESTKYFFVLEEKMNDKEKLEKVLKYVTDMENKFYKPIEEGKCDPTSLAAMHNLISASCFQRVRYFVESLLEENNE